VFQWYVCFFSFTVLLAVFLVLVRVLALPSVVVPVYFSALVAFHKAASHQ